MSADLVSANSPEVIAWKTAQRIAATEFVPEAFRRRPEAVFAAILYGRELGMGPMQSLRAVNVIKGKPTLAPEAMRAHVFAAGHTITTEHYDNEQVTLIGVRADTEAEATVTWTLDDARRAGLLKQGGAWMSYPRAMLLARATSELCRLLFPDVIAGASYTPEEMGAVPDVIDVEEVSGVSTPEEGAPSPVSRKADGDGKPELEEVSANQLEQARARAAHLQAEKISVASERKAAGLPTLSPGIAPGTFGRWLELLDRLDQQLEDSRAPFEEAQ